ncbi:DUF11 domain-containing protein [Candidatus Woesearchaeota archaeon]|nr:DUF11 domain-containing protein [Candidatus Woesearchaeota archaeon]
MSAKKRCITVLLLFILAVIFSASAAARTKVFDDRVLSGENVEIDDFTFIITMNKYASAIFVDAGTMYQSVPLFGCKKMESFEICFKNTTFDEEENELYAEVNITRSKPDLTVTRTMNDTEFYVGQEAEVTIKVTNTGDPASNVILTDDYPAGIDIYDLEGGCQVHENQVYWQGHLDEEEEKECRFIMKGTKEIHQSFVVHLKYWDGFKWVDDYSSTLTVDIEPVIEIFSAVVREDYEVDGTTFDFDGDNPNLNIGEELRLIVNITNNYNDYIDLDAFELLLPPDLAYKTTGSLRFNYINATGDRSSIIWYSDRLSRISGSILRWSGRIKEGNSKLFIAKIEARRTGDQNMMIRTDYSYDEMHFSDTKYKSITVRDPGMAIRMTVEDKSRIFSAAERLDEEDNSIDIEALHPYSIKVYAQNINKYAKLKDVNVRVYTELAGFQPVHYSEMDEEGQRIPYSIVLIPPNSASSVQYKTNVSITYTSEFGEKHENSTEFLITVQPSKDLTIEWESSEGEVLEGGEETEVKVSVTNDRLVDLRNVEVKDDIPPDLHIEGVHAKKVKLNKDSATEIYTYRLIPPIVHNKTYYNITTTVSFFDPDLQQEINFTETTTLTINPLKPDISIDVTLDEPGNIYPGTLIPADYTVRNDEEKEVVRQITVHFPVQENIDLIGPKTFFIDRLDPGEEVVIKNLVKIRPKIVNDGLKLEKTSVEYYDNYGNLFGENSTEDIIDVEDALINGPAIFLRTIIPEVINKSTSTIVKVEVKNNGTAAADITVEQEDKMWNVTVAEGSAAIIEYPVKYDSEGNYTIPEPFAHFMFQGLDAYTKGTGAEAHVQLILGPAEEAVEEAPPAVAEEMPEPEKEEMSFEEYEAKAAIEQRKLIVKYGTVGIIAVLILVIIAAYISYRRKKGPSAPFVES